MRNTNLSLAFVATIFLLASPADAFNQGPPPKKPPMTKSIDAAAKPARHGAARSLVSTGKAVVKRGKQSIRSQKENLIRLVGRAEALKPQRLRLRQQTLDAHRAYRANPNSATRAAWKAAVTAYMPVRQAHETARGQRDAANARYKLTKSQRKAAVKAAASAPAASTPRTPTRGRPAIRRQAFIDVSQAVASAASSPRSVYSSAQLPLPQVVRPEGHYSTFRAADFKVDAKAHYDRLTPSEAGLNRQSGSAGSLSGSSGTLPTMPFFISPKVPIRQNTYDDV